MPTKLAAGMFAMPLALVVAEPAGEPLSVKLIVLPATAGDNVAVRLEVPPYVPVAAVTTSVVTVFSSTISTPLVPPETPAILP